MSELAKPKHDHHKCGELICSLSNENAALKAEVEKANKLKELNDWHERWVQSEKEIDKLQAEISKLKVEAEAWRESNLQFHKANEILKSSNVILESRAAKYREALKDHICPTGYPQKWHQLLDESALGETGA